MYILEKVSKKEGKSGRKVVEGHSRELYMNPDNRTHDYVRPSHSRGPLPIVPATTSSCISPGLGFSLSYPACTNDWTATCIQG